MGLKNLLAIACALLIVSVGCNRGEEEAPPELPPAETPTSPPPAGQPITPSAPGAYNEPGTDPPPANRLPRTVARERAAQASEGLGAGTDLGNE